MTEDMLGKTVGGYEILRQIGQGGMAAVYLALQKSMNREVALKVLPRQYLNDDTYLQRFEQEAKIVSTLEHRNIVPVYDYGEVEHQPYIVMRYLPGGSVDDLIRKGPMPSEQALDILAQVAPALDYAHTKNILHRDLKPSNVLLDDNGGAFITDFGIARILGQQGPAITTQGVVGTPSYMSPEQAQAHPLDGRSDVYALGVMLFEMLTGRRPFESDTPYSIAVMQVTKSPPSPRKLNPALSPVVESVIFKVLQKNPEDRYQTAQELVEALRRALEKDHKQHDTEPKMKIPEHMLPQQAAQPISSPASPSVAQQYQPHTPGSAPPMQSVPPRAGARRKSSNNILLGMTLGGLLGCGLLTILVIGAILLIGSLLNNNGTPDAGAATATTPVQTPGSNSAQATNTGEIPTLDATSIAARQTLIAARGSAGSTPPPTEAPNSSPATPGVQPVGVREGTPDLIADLDDVTGSIVFFDQRSGASENTFEIVKLNLESWIETQLTQDLSDNSYPAPSPDGRWIAFQSNRDGDFEIYVMNPVGGQLRQLTFNDHIDRLPWWSPDGQWIVYSADVRGDGTYDLYRIRPDGSENQVVFSNGYRNSHARYSPDGRQLTFTSGSDPLNGRTWEIAVLNLENQEASFLTNNTYRDSAPTFSPDGALILYTSFNDGDTDIVEMNGDGSGRRILYNDSSSDWSANYSPDGRFIVFTATIDGTDQLFLMTADGSAIQQITINGGAYASWIPGAN